MQKNQFFSTAFGNVTNTKECRVCKENGITGKFHRHYSTAHGRKRYLKAGEKDWFCKSCNRNHQVEIQGGRHKILATSSTLHTTWTDASFQPNPFHLDEISIPGARFAEVAENVLKTYAENPQPFDVIIVAYLNDVRATPIEAFEKNIEEFYDRVEAHEKFFHVKNSAAVVKIFKPPSLTRYNLDEKITKEEIHEQFVDYGLKMKLMSQVVDKVNKKYKKAENICSLENFGKRRVFKQGIMQNQHIMSKFREKDQTKKLHLTNSEKVKAYQKVIKYMQMNTIRCPEDENM